MKLTTFDTKGKPGKEVVLSADVFEVPMQKDMVHQVLVSMQANKRQGNAHTKDRSEVRGGGKKPWRQKGTGRARHGSSRSPIWVGGGVTFGPRNDRNYSKKINRKMRLRALAMALSAKTKQENVLGLVGLSLAEPKTSIAADALKQLEKGSGKTLNVLNPNNILFITAEGNLDKVRSFRNLPHVTMVSAREVSALDVAQKRFIVLDNPEEVNKILEARVAGNYQQVIASEEDKA